MSENKKEKIQELIKELKKEDAVYCNCDCAIPVSCSCGRLRIEDFVKIIELLLENQEHEKASLEKAIDCLEEHLSNRISNLNEKDDKKEVL